MRKMSGHWENVYEFSMDALICACCASGKEGMRMEDIVRVCFGPTDFVQTLGRRRCLLRPQPEEGNSPRGVKVCLRQLGLVRWLTHSHHFPHF